uniref:BSD domain-containing protein n=1 Tax=Chromera velia CCMP2878 TaxID=1169474 RepID=A0A0G4GJ74_9ALVE|eukprot:Cvel_4774.t1-p1 / transcript=Cvel_4774.t1 / gene=Cvel_4774 / organism=Chromera_velia_CCMP2878 / gene_product=hypothetical protein / transcript_product=hypothetical protein / location=Cvel_scaffold213:41987-44338(-) / protein_length=319 / sequence_SO=supercontig / SO=protein_coding / is_pseudo=false
MGASESHDDPSKGYEMLDLEGGGTGFQDDAFPWFHIVQWCCETALPDRVFRWDLNAIKERVDEMTADADAFLHFCPRAKVEGFTMDDATNFCEWAGALLKKVPSLAAVRFRLVPARMNEETFWQRFFSAVREEVKRHVDDIERELALQEQREEEKEAKAAAAAGASQPTPTQQPNITPPPPLHPPSTGSNGHLEQQPEVRILRNACESAETHTEQDVGCVAPVAAALQGGEPTPVPTWAPAPYADSRNAGQRFGQMPVQESAPSVQFPNAPSSSSTVGTRAPSGGTRGPGGPPHFAGLYGGLGYPHLPPADAGAEEGGI